MNIFENGLRVYGYDMMLRREESTGVQDAHVWDGEGSGDQAVQDV